MTFARARRLAATLLLLLLFAPPASAASDEARRPETATARPGVVRRMIDVTGIAVADPAQRAPLRAERPSQIDRILVRPGDVVAAGAPLLTLLPSPAEQQFFAQAQTNAAIAARDLAVEQQRHALGMASNSSLFVAQQNFDRAETQVLIGQQRFRFSTGEVTVTAPYAARVEEIPLAQGSFANAQATVMTLAPESALIALLDVPPEKLRLVHPGAFAVIYPVAAGGNRITTHIEGAGGLVDMPSLPGRLAIHLPQGSTYGFGIDQRIAASIAVEERQGLVVPFGAVQRDARGDYVTRLEDGRPRRAGVKIGLTDGVQTIIELGLAAGDEVIVPREPRIPPRHS